MIAAGASPDELINPDSLGTRTNYALPTLAQYKANCIYRVAQHKYSDFEYYYNFKNGVVWDSCE